MMYDFVRAGWGGVDVVLPVGGRLPIRSVIGIGRNYAEHAAEQGADLPKHPMVFTKSPVSIALAGEPIAIPAICRDPAFSEDPTGGQVDYEAELAVVIGRDAKDVTEAEALDHVLGYTCGNDVSARWWQKVGAGGQFCRGKSFDTFCPIGPRIIAAKDVPDPKALRIRCRLNGDTMQDGSTSDMIFPVATLIAELSKGTTIPAGTVILTGTPEGVGMARTPRVWLKAGDTVEIELEGSFGTLTLSNPVEDA